MNRSSIVVGWVVLTIIAIVVSSAAVGSVGDRVTPQPASVLQAAGGVAAFAADEVSDSQPIVGSPTTSIIDPADAVTAPSTTVAGVTGSPSTQVPGSTTSAPPRGPSTTTTVVDATTTTVVDATTTTIVDATTTTTASPPTTTTVSPPTTTVTTTTEAPQVKRRTIESKGGWIWVEWTPTELVLVKWSPKPGFRATVLEREADRVVVRFASTDHVSRIIVRLTDDFRIRVEKIEEPRES